MEFLRKIFGRRPVDIAGRQLRKAKRDLLFVLRDLEEQEAVRSYLFAQISRLESFVKFETAEVKEKFTHDAFEMATRNKSQEFSGLSKSLSNVANAFGKFGNTTSKVSNITQASPPPRKP